MTTQPVGVAVVGAVEPVMQAQAMARRTVTDQLVAQVLALLAGFTAWFDDAAVARLSTQIAGLVQPSQRVVAALTDAYLARVVSEVRGSGVKPVGVVDVSKLRAGVDPATEYQRLARQYRREVSTGVTVGDAADRVRSRAEVMAGTDVALANRAQAQKFAVVRQVKGWRRVIHPELSKGGVCGLCIAASQRVYSGSRLMPIHDRCVCEPMPIINDVDPGDVLNKSDLEKLYETAGSTKAGDLKRTRYQVDQHGELGPVLVPARRDGGSYRARAVGGLGGMTRQQLEHQLGVVQGLKDSQWRTDRLKALRGEIASRAGAA